MGSSDPVFRWRKSSRSGGNGQCVELGVPDWVKPTWRKSSRSGQNGACVEIANHGAVRDSKNPDGAVIRVYLDSFLDSVKSGRLDH